MRSAIRLPIGASQEPASLPAPQRSPRGAGDAAQPNGQRHDEQGDTVIQQRRRLRCRYSQKQYHRMFKFQPIDDMPAEMIQVAADLDSPDAQHEDDQRTDGRLASPSAESNPWPRLVVQRLSTVRMQNVLAPYPILLRLRHQLPLERILNAVIATAPDNHLRQRCLR